jgi:hypothetical protein
MESDKIFWDYKSITQFTREGECKITKATCRNENVNCQRCNVPLLFPKASLAILGETTTKTAKPDMSEFDHPTIKRQK